jgi:tetratricopeptide (TPR) repeat protein
LDGNWSARIGLIYAYTYKGMYPEALAEYEKLPPLRLFISSSERPVPRSRELHPGLAYVYGAAGRTKEAQTMVDDLVLASKEKYVDPFDIAADYAVLDKDKAFEWLERAYEERSVQMPQLKVNPRLDPLLSDPRFQDLVRRMNFPN